MMRAEWVCKSILEEETNGKVWPGSKAFIFIFEPKNNQWKNLRSERHVISFIYSFIVFYSTIHLYFPQIFSESQALS